MDASGGYYEYAFVADLYDHVVPYRNRPDVAFFVEAAKESGGPVLELGCRMWRSGLRRSSGRAGLRRPAREAR